MTSQNKQSHAVRLIDFFLKKNLEQVLNGAFITMGISGIAAFFTTFYVANWSTVIDGTEGFGTGSFGDAFGFTTSVFTGAAFLGLAASTLLQRQELKATNDSLSELQKQTEDVKEAQKIQLNEDRFFKLMETIETRASKTNKPYQLADQVAATLANILDVLVKQGFKGAQLREQAEHAINTHRQIVQLNETVDYVQSLGIYEIAAADNAIKEGKLEHLSGLLSSKLYQSVTALLMIYDAIGLIDLRSGWVGEEHANRHLNPGIGPSTSRTYWPAIARLKGAV